LGPIEKFFSSVYTVESDHNFEPLSVRTMSNHKKMTELVVHKGNIEQELAKLKINKSPGPDELHPRVLYESREIICPLCLIYNKSLSLGLLPSEWKSAEVTAIYKKGSKCDRGNYRSVNLTSVCCRILEQLIRDRMMEYLLGNRLISDKRYGFISGRSTSLQLLHMLDKWLII